MQDFRQRDDHKPAAIISTTQQNTDRNALEELEAAIQPDVDGGADGSDLPIEGVGNNQEVVCSNGEKLPVICPRSGQGLVYLKQLKGWERW